MIPFQRVTLEDKAAYEQILFSSKPRSCEYSFANLFCWGVQTAAFLNGCAAMFSHFGGRSIYPYPIGSGDRRAVLAAIIQDAADRGIPCRISGMSQADCQELESWFPGEFQFRSHRDGSDYVYAIDDLADLKGRKFQKKRNHVNRFLQEHPNYQTLPLNADTMAAARQMAADWYIARKARDPQGDYQMEGIALNRALRKFTELGLEGCILMDEGRVLALTVGSRLSEQTMDIHFEKALEDSDGTYAMINREFARYLREKYPELCYLNREDDMGLEGLRKAKLSYNPHHLEEKYWAVRIEDVLMPEEHHDPS